MNNFLITMLLAIFTSSLAGCASFLPSGGQDKLQESLTALNDWQVRGKLSVTSPQDSVTGYLTWEQQADQYQLFITGPFGQGSSRLSGDKNSAALLLPGWEHTQKAASAEQLMLTHMGWNFPVEDIRHWVKGQPSPESEATVQYGDSGLLENLQQHGWQVRYSRYSQHGGFWLPGLIKVSGHSFRFVFSIKEWTING